MNFTTAFQSRKDDELVYNSAMEFANAEDVAARQARETDLLMLSRLMEDAAYRHRHADWFLPSEWLNTPSFVVVDTVSHSQNHLLGCLAVTTEVLPAAWVRLAAIRNRDHADQLMENMLKQVIPFLQQSGVKELGWLISYGWPGSIFNRNGFSITNWIVTYDAPTGEQDPIIQPDVNVRPAELTDMDELADIETKAFEPLWRLNVRTLNRAYDQAFSFDVATLDDVVVGFQLSLLSHNKSQAHLVRITVDPAFQRQGVGTALVSTLMSECFRRGIKQISLNTQIDNISSHRLYEKFQFQRTGDQIPLYTKRIE
jgi:ribosomal protein S18 acetylase RimI-like enzyme